MSPLAVPSSSCATYLEMTRSWASRRRRCADLWAAIVYVGRPYQSDHVWTAARTIIRSAKLLHMRPTALVGRAFVLPRLWPWAWRLTMTELKHLYRSCGAMPLCARRAMQSVCDEQSECKQTSENLTMTAQTQHAHVAELTMPSATTTRTSVKISTGARLCMWHPT